jgi:glycosyltransferase involved in cell wall biosynthesis
MKIAFLINACSSGGAEVLVKDILLELAHSGHRIQLWVMCRVKDDIMQTTEARLAFEKQYIDDLISSGIKIVFLGKRAKKDRLKVCCAIRKAYDLFEPEIIHTHSESITFYVIAALYGKKYRLVETIHNTKINHAILQKIMVAKRVASLVAISKEVQEKMKEVGLPENKISLLYNGCHTERFSCPDRDFGEVAKYLIAVGRLSKQKDYPFLIEAYKTMVGILNQQCAYVPKLRIIGEGEERRHIETLIEEYGLAERIELLGVRNDIPEQLSQADIYVMSSRWEGFSISLIEANAAGLPIVATNVGSNRLVVRDGVNGFLVENGDVKTFAARLVELTLSSEIRRTFSEQSVQIATQYDICETAKKHLELYRNIQVGN